MVKISSNPNPQLFIANEKQKNLDLQLKIQPEIDHKKNVRDTILRQISELQAARLSKGEDDPQAKFLIEKFKSGKKLSTEEMNYIREHAPGMVEYIERISREREIWELGMKLAPSKLDVDMVALQNAQQIEKHHSSEERLVRARHLVDAVHEYKQTDEYKDKPNTILDKESDNEIKLTKVNFNEDEDDTNLVLYNNIKAYEKVLNAKTPIQ